ncbi:TolC family protein [Fibrobacter sp. UBA4297]|uniref:TolC family protein n=1 Tax=Fibrobacter sp. UBA4297 TaxID=1946536 RepID=UPI0025C42EE6|nr:TolC family protein [Fibrobacter sp. UBA4297]
MSRKFLVLSALALGLIVPASAKTYTRDEAIKTAMENSSDIKTAEEELIKASSQVESGYGNAYPSIDLSANVTRIFGLDDVKKTSALTDAAKDMADEKDDAGYPKANAYDQNVIGPALDGMTYGMKSQAYRWQSSVGLTVTQILYAAGKVGTAIDIAKAYKHLEEVNLEDKKAKVRYEVDNAFDQLIYLDSSIAIVDESMKITQDNIDFVEQGVKSGLATELDLARVQLAMEALKVDRKTLEDKRLLAKNALLNTMGLDWDNDVQFNGELRSPESNLPYPDTSMASVKQRRKELVMLQATETMKEKNIEIEEGGYKPTIALVGGLKYANNQNKITEWDAPKWDKLNKYVSLNLSMNLFNGMKTKEAVVQAKSSLRSTQIQKETAERGFRVQIESCAQTLASSERNLEVLKNNIDLAQRIYDMTDAAFRNGMETQLNLLTANMDLRKAKLNYLQGILNWNTAYNALLQATGEY